MPAASWEAPLTSVSALQLPIPSYDPGLGLCGVWASVGHFEGINLKALL